MQFSSTFPIFLVQQSLTARLCGVWAYFLKSQFIHNIIIMNISHKTKFLFLIGNIIIVVATSLIIPIKGLYFKEIIINLLTIGILSGLWVFIIRNYMKSER
jgi:hypothetical protein